MTSKVNDHRVRVTKMLIRKAFTDLLSRKPIQSISVKELCEQAGINRGTFYAHYADIYDLLAQMEEEMRQDFMQALEPILNAEDAALTPLKITAGVFQCLKDNADICTVTLGPHGDKAFAAQLLQVGQDKCIESYTKYFTGASQRQIEYFYAFASAGCIGLLQKWLSGGTAISAEEVAAMAEAIMMSGIGFLQKDGSKKAD